jgi:hypothetical protein
MAQYRPLTLEEILSQPQTPHNASYTWNTQPGEITPLWAILGDEPPFDEQYTANFGQVVAKESEGPESCDEHYPPDHPLSDICEAFGDNDWANCVRACLYKVVPEEWQDDIEFWDEDTLHWAAEHWNCWTGCQEGGPLR